MKSEAIHIKSDMISHVRGVPGSRRTGPSQGLSRWYQSVARRRRSRRRHTAAAGMERQLTADDTGDRRVLRQLAVLPEALWSRRWVLRINVVVALVVFVVDPPGACKCHHSTGLRSWVCVGHFHVDTRFFAGYFSSRSFQITKSVNRFIFSAPSFRIILSLEQNMKQTISEIQFSQHYSDHSSNRF